MAAHRTRDTLIVLECIEDLYNQNMPATRETVAEATGLKIGKVDERLKVLYAEHEIRRVISGCYAPAYKHPPARLISKIALPCGTIKLEIGDDYAISLTPREARILSSMMAGEATQLIAITASERDAMSIAAISQRVAHAVRKAEEVEARLEAMETAQQLNEH